MQQHARFQTTSATHEGQFTYTPDTQVLYIYVGDTLLVISNYLMCFLLVN